MIELRERKQLEGIQMRAMRITALAAILAVGITGAGCSRGGHKESARKVPAKTVQAIEADTAVVEKKKSRDVYAAVGAVQSQTTVTISGKVMGFIKALNAEEGARVAKGQILVEIDAPETSARVNQARAGTEEARSALSEVENGISAAESAVDSARAGYELADATYKRFEKLVLEDSVSKQEFDEARAKWKMAQSALTASEKNLAAMKSRRSQVKARIKQAESGAAEASDMLAYTVIRSPISGTVVDKKLETGSLAAPGMPILVIEDSSAYRLEANVDESRVSKIKIGDAATISIDALGGKKTTGTVAEIKPAADAASRTFTVKIALPYMEGMRSGMFGRAYFDMGESEKTMVPKAAITERGGAKGVFVMDENGALRFRVVKAGDESGGFVEIFSGLTPGEKILASNADRATDGGKALVRDND